MHCSFLMASDSGRRVGIPTISLSSLVAHLVKSFSWCVIQRAAQQLVAVNVSAEHQETVAAGHQETQERKFHLGHKNVNSSS